MTSPAPAASSSSLAFVPRRVKRTTAATRSTRLVPSLPVSLDYPANVLLRVEIRSQLPIKEDSNRSLQQLAEIKTRRLTERIVSHCVDYVEIKEIKEQLEDGTTEWNAILRISTTSKATSLMKGLQDKDIVCSLLNNQEQAEYWKECRAKIKNRAWRRVRQQK